MVAAGLVVSLRGVELIAVARGLLSRPTASPHGRPAAALVDWRARFREGCRHGLCGKGGDSWMRKLLFAAVIAASQLLAFALTVSASTGGPCCWSTRRC